MECKRCKKECLESELTNGYCDECLKKCNGDYKKIKNKNNTIAFILKIWCLIIVVVGFILSIIEFIYNEEILLGTIVLGSFWSISILLLSLAEIIQLLEDIKNK